MMTLYPYPNTSSIPDLFNYTNTYACVNYQGNPLGDFACGWFYPIILFSIFAIVMLSQKDTQPSANAFALSSFITFVLAVMLMPFGINMIWVELFFVVMVIASISLWRSE